MSIRLDERRYAEELKRLVADFRSGRIRWFRCRMASRTIWCGGPIVCSGRRVRLLYPHPQEV